MSVNKIVFVAIACALLVTACSALTSADIQIEPEKSQLTADGVDNTTIRIAVSNYTSPLSGQIVLDNPAMGKVAPSSFSLSPAYATFTANKTSGKAKIFVNVTDGVSDFASSETTIDLVHGEAYRIADLHYEQEIVVNDTTPIRVRVVDKFNNPVMNSNFTFTVSSPKGNARFVGSGGVFDKSITDADGYAAVDLHVDTVAGDNIVLIDAPAGVDDRWIDIITHGSDPVSIEPTYDPDPSILPADNHHTLEATYVLRDRWSNPSPNQKIEITTTLGERASLTTDSMGRAMMRYGPKRSTGTLNITATVMDNTSITCTQRVEFTSSDPASLLVSASPDNMQSLDLNDATTSEIRARLVDRAGHPIRGEEVSFSIENIEAGNFTQTEMPKFSNGQLTDTNTTGDDGYASVPFIPGRFAVEGEEGYLPDAIASCVVRATWNDLSEPTTLTWRNYLYLRVETDVSKTVINSTDPYFDVTVRLIGDGPELKEKIPIDVVLCTDRSGSMLKDYPDRMIPVMDASYAFVTTMDVGPAEDHIGLVSFGTEGWAKIAPTRSYSSWNWNNIYGGQTGSSPLSNNPGWWWVGRDNYYDCTPSSYSSSSNHHQYVLAHYPENPKDYDDYAVVEQHLSSSTSTINTSINGMVPSGGTPLRFGVYKAINEIIANGRDSSSTVRAIIVLSDGDYNYYGDPLARGTGSTNSVTSYGDLTRNYYRFTGLGSGQSSNQNMSNYARNNNISIYSIGYADDISDDGKETLRILAEGTGGKYYDGSATDIADVYESIAGELQKQATINTRMHLNLVSNITNPGASWSSTQGLLEYIFIDGYSTYWRHYNWTDDPYEPATVFRYGMLNQTNEWRNSQTLTFDESVIGTMRRKETWEARFRLKVNGSVNETLGFSLFGPNSNIVVNGTETEIITPPNADITWIPNMSGSDLPSGVITITGLTNTSPPREYLNLTWTVEYTGNSETTYRTLYYTLDKGTTWVKYAEWPWTNESGREEYRLDLRKLPATSRIGIRIVAEAPGAGRNMDWNYFNIPLREYFIKIE
ncbi:MAG: hypothetical protein QMD46_00805 [Methanomicrobiales archaeon]|nr:hypothetical protein [Methanomicrobiales archaeon]